MEIRRYIKTNINTRPLKRKHKIKKKKMKQMQIICYNPIK